jgi:catechol 2,3-dioxygenase-like lactoylglutathione lyase family enzyme
MSEYASALYDPRMEILASRILITPRDPERTRAFYGHTLGLHVFREFGAGPGRGVVYFLGGGFLEVSGQGASPASDATQIWLQVRSVSDTHVALVAAGAPIEEAPVVKPWGLLEMRARDPDDRLLVFIEVPEDHPLRKDSRSP